MLIAIYNITLYFLTKIKGFLKVFSSASCHCLYIGGYFLSVVLDNEIQNYYDKTIIDDNDYMCQYINCGIVFCDVGSEESGSEGGTYNNKIGLCNHNFILGL